MDVQGRLMQAQLFAQQSGNARTQATAADDSSSSDAATASATITANDFLTLLVTELKNQDPTNQTDPNEYVDQLVQVNSLEQLIQINQNTTTATSTSGASGGVVPVSSPISSVVAAMHAPHKAAAQPQNLPGSSQLSAPDGSSVASAMKVAGSLAPGSSTTGAAAAAATGLPVSGSRLFSIPGNPALR